MLITILLVGNIIVILSLLYIVGCSDSAPKFQIPYDEYKINQDELADEDNAKVSPWDYYTSLRHKSWDELSEYEKRRMVLAAHIILDECGTLSTLSELEEFLKNHLPEIPDTCLGDDGVLGGFIEWKRCMISQNNSFEDIDDD